MRLRRAWVCVLFILDNVIISFFLQGFDVSSFPLSSQLLYVAGLSEDDFGMSSVTTSLSY